MLLGSVVSQELDPPCLAGLCDQMPTVEPAKTNAISAIDPVTPLAGRNAGASIDKERVVLEQVRITMLRNVAALNGSREVGYELCL